MPAFVRILTQNWKLKALALALAVLLWVVVSAEQVTSNWVPVPLQVRVNNPEYRLIHSSLPAEVEVRFSGPGRELLDMAVRRPPLVLSITDVDSITQIVRLGTEMVQVPSQLAVRALEVRPGAVTLDFQRVESRLIPVRVRISRGPGAGWTLVDSLEVRPNQVRISGLEEDLRGVDAVSTTAVELSPGDSVFTRTVALDTAGRPWVRFSAAAVRISGHVDRFLERTFSDYPVSVGQGVAIQPRTVTVRVRGPRTRLERLAEDAFRVVVSIDSIPMRIPAEGILVPLRAERLPPGMQADVSPGAVRLLPARMFLDSVPETREEEPADTASLAPPGGGG